MYRTRSYVCAENSKMRNRSPSYAEMSFTTDLKKTYGKLCANFGTDHTKNVSGIKFSLRQSKRIKFQRLGKCMNLGKFTYAYIVSTHFWSQSFQT